MDSILHIFFTRVRTCHFSTGHLGRSVNSIFWQRSSGMRSEEPERRDVIDCTGRLHDRPGSPTTADPVRSSSSLPPLAQSLKSPFLASAGQTPRTWKPNSRKSRRDGRGKSALQCDFGGRDRCSSERCGNPRRIAGFRSELKAKSPQKKTIQPPAGFNEQIKRQMPCETIYLNKKGPSNSRATRPMHVHHGSGGPDECPWTWW